MRCEVCGRKIYGKPHKAIIEGAKLTVCSECAEHGKVVQEEGTIEKKVRKIKHRAKPVQSKTKTGKTPPLSTEDDLELVDNFDVKIRQAREERGLSQVDLGTMINEKVSVLKKLETGKMPPDNQLAKKLEHTLNIKLLIPASEKEVPKTKIPHSGGYERTLGDLIQLDKKEVEEKTKRG